MVIQLASPLQDEKIKMQQAQYMPRPTSVAAPQKGPLQAAGETIGGNVAGTVVDGALFGGETGATLGMGNTGLISKGMSGLTGMLGGGAGAGSAAAGAGAAPGPHGSPGGTFYPEEGPGKKFKVVLYRRRSLCRSIYLKQIVFK